MTLDLNQQNYNEENENTEILGTLISLNSNSSHLLIQKDETTIGRTSGVDFHFKDPRISGLHCKIIRNTNTNEFVILDSSTNGTYVNEERIGKGNTMLITSGDELVIATEYKGNKTLDPIKFIFQNHCYVETKQNQIISEIDESEIGKLFEINEILGKGTFGIVYLATHIETEKQVALKVIHKKKLAQFGENQDFKKEIEYLTSLNHPYLIEVYEVYETEQYIIICLEVIIGGNLAELLEQNERIDEDSAKMIFYQILTAVNYLHLQGIVHKDLKPENILIKDQRNPLHTKITDFGLSRMLHSQTMLRTLCGTPVYLAPEVMSAGLFGDEAAVDMWSLGIILYQLLSGTLPIHINTDLITIFDQINNFSIHFDKSWIGISEEAKDLVVGLLEMDPKKRFTAKDALNHIWIANTEFEDPIVENNPFQNQQTLDLNDNDFNPLTSQRTINQDYNNNKRGYW
ncbi:serine/threonine-protein kinase fhke-related [Anaeramoeba flamelloides]|uniref:Serine/threonine-protein kinase fhke-related n=1 Tax=Anaeramoeba flamelloides TaxID=1746091 RepID=A0AAV7ZPT9_9EUKA|nr:serine/threonine-protein kinase fhke-related [Anaeramoeba flamelloides]